MINEAQPLRVFEAGQGGLLLETSAQLFRLVGDQGLRKEIDDLMRRFARVGTSQFVVREFEVIIRGLYDCVERGLRKLPGQDRGRAIQDLLSAATFELPPFIKGGPKLLAFLTAAIVVTFPDGSVSPRKIANWCAGQKHGALEFFYHVQGRDIRVTRDIVDCSSCCTWPGQKRNLCNPEPHPDDCRLKSLCLAARETFLSYLATLAKSDVSEADWISSNIAKLRSLDGCELLWFVGRNPNPLGDAIIFGETPEGWDILTRDRAFPILQRDHRAEMRVYCIRSPRYPANRRCSIWPSRSSESEPRREGFIQDYSATGMAVLTENRLGNVGDRVLVTSDLFDEEQKGIIVRVPVTDSSWIHGIRIVKNQ